MSTRSILTTSIVIALTAAATGCGSGSDDEADTLTKAEMISQGSEICSRAEQRVAELPELTSQHPFTKSSSASDRQAAREFLAGYADLLAGSREQLAALESPPEDRELLDGYLADLAEVADGLRDAAAAPAAVVEDRADAAFVLFARASEQTAAYGFPKGVCGSGEGD